MVVVWGRNVCSSLSSGRVGTGSAWGGLPRKGKEPRFQQSHGEGMTRKMKVFLKIYVEKIEKTQEKTDFYWQEKGRI